MADPRLFVREFLTVEFASGTKRYWSDAGAVTIDGLTYTGDCSFASVEGIDGNISQSMASVTLLLSAADPAILADFADGDEWHFRRITYEVKSFDQAYRSITTSYDLRYPGLIDAVHRPRGLGPAVLAISIVDLLKLSVLNSSSFRTDGDQRGRLGTDSIMRNVAHVTSPSDDFWGKRQPAFGNASVHSPLISKR